MTWFIGQAAGVLLAPGLAAAGAAAVSIPLAIHLLSRMRRQREPWAAMRFLAMAYRRHRRKLRLESWLLLATRCLIVAILGLALAGPVLTGCVGHLLGATTPGGQRVYLVIDNAMSSGTTAASNQSRLDGYKQSAKRIIAGLGPDDSAALWSAARPAKAVIETPTADHAEAREALSAIEPTFSRSALAATLSQINGQLERRGVGPARTRVIVFSDWPAGAAFLDHPPSEKLSALADNAQLWVSRPPSPATNISLVDVQPRQSNILPGGVGGAQAQASVPVQVTLERRTDTAAAEQTRVRLALVKPGGQTVTSKTRSINWEAGRTQTRTSISLSAQAVMQSLGEDERQPLMVTANVLAKQTSDALAADNQAQSLVEVRAHLRIGLIDQPLAGTDRRGPMDHDKTASSDADEGGDPASATDSAGETARTNDLSGKGSAVGKAMLEPGQWIRLALSPGGGLGRAMSVRSITPASLTPQTLGSLDAAIVLRADRLSPQQWSALAAFCQAGGLVWVFPTPTASSITWAKPLAKAFDLDWQIGLEPVDVSGSQAPPPNSEAKSKAANGQRGESGAGAATATSRADEASSQTRGRIDSPSPPRAWSLLATNLPQLMRPVHVSQALDLHVPKDAAWLLLSGQSGQSSPTNQTADDGSNGEASESTPASDSESPGDRVWAVLAYKPRGGGGAGGLLLSGTALDLNWTNLMAKPLFVAMVQQSVRGVLGRSNPNQHVQAGDRPVFNPSTWSASGQLHRVLDGSTKATNDSQRIKLSPANLASQSGSPTSQPAGVRPDKALNRPGLYIVGGGASSTGVESQAEADSDTHTDEVAETDNGDANANPASASKARPTIKRSDLLVVNPDPAGGQTRPIAQAALQRWLAPFTGWHWLDEQNPAAMLGQAGSRPRIGWHLLWVVLALILLETLLARRFSHAQSETAQTPNPGLTNRVLTAFRRVSPNGPRKKNKQNLKQAA